MKISLKWLQRHIKLNNTNIDIISDNLFKLGFEIDNIEYVNEIESCTIKSVKKINDTLSFCSIQTHYSNKLAEVVCGGDNLYVGMKTLYAKPETIINGITLQKKKILGHYSYGMLLSSEEADLNNNINGNIIEDKCSSPDGILDITNEKIHLYKDIILHSEIATNRWDLKNIRGIARQLSILGLGEFLTLPLETGKDDLSFEIINNTSIKGSFIQVKNITIKNIMEELCNNIGIYNTNKLQYLNDFILLDIGHPIHIYDKKYIDKIQIDSANDEVVSTIKNQEFQCNKNNIVIKNSSEIISIGGIIGVKGYEDNTTHVVIEACWFRPNHITNNCTDSANMFFMDIDHQLTTLEYIGSLIEGNKSKIFYCGSTIIENNEIFLSHSYVNLFTGLDLSLNNLHNILTSRNFSCQIIKKISDTSLTDQFGLTVKIPSYRTDIKHQRDLIEEIMLDITYDIFTESNNIEQLPNIQDISTLENRVKDILVINGFHEVYNLPFIGEKSKYKLLNSLNKTRSYLRDDSFYSLLENANTMLLHRYHNISLFEIEHNYLHLILGGKSVATWSNGNKNDIFHLKKVINNLQSILNIEEQYTFTDNIFNQGYQLDCGKYGILKFQKNFPKLKNICYLKIKLIEKPKLQYITQNHKVDRFDISINSNLPWEKIRSYITIDYVMFDIYEKDNNFNYNISVFSRSHYDQLIKIFQENNITVN